MSNDQATCDIELPDGVRGQLPLNVRLGGSAVSLSSTSLEVMAVGRMTTLSVEPSIVPAAGSPVVTVHGEGFVRTAALTCRVGKVGKLPAVFVSSRAVECPLPADISGNISVSVVGSVGSATMFLFSNARQSVGLDQNGESSLQFRAYALQPTSGPTSQESAGPTT